MTFANYVTLFTAVLMTILILVQTRGATLGAGLGGGGEVNTVRRGADKSLHQFTIIVVFVFTASIFLSVVG